MNKTNIYVIKGANRYYVGKSNDVNQRFCQHKRQAKNALYPNEKDKWIVKYESRLSVTILERVPMDKWRDREKYWIKKYRKKYGFRLLNATSGGEGPSMIEEKTPQPVSNVNYLAAGLLLCVGSLISLTGVGAIVGVPMIFAAVILCNKK